MVGVNCILKPSSQLNPLAENFIEDEKLQCKFLKVRTLGRAAVAWEDTQNGRAVWSLPEDHLTINAFDGVTTKKVKEGSILKNLGACHVVHNDSSICIAVVMSDWILYV